MAFNTIPEIIEDIRAGRMVVMVDDEDRENEGDLIMAASAVRPEDINFMISEARGLVCLALDQERCRQLALQPMVCDNSSPFHTNFTVSIEAAEGVTTGISAFDRAHTIRVAVKDDAGPADLHQPGHVFPLAAHADGVLGRAGHTETAVDLARLAGLAPAGVLVEVLKADGSMARQPELHAFAQRHGLKLGTVADLIRYRQQNDPVAAPPLAGARGKMSGSMNAQAKTPALDTDCPAPGGARYAIVASRWNADVVEALVRGARQALQQAGVADDAVQVLRVPGAWDIPAAAAKLAGAGQHAAIIALGCVIRGETRHYEHVADGCAQGLMDVATHQALPVLNGVLAVERKEHALARAGGAAGNKGFDVARAAVEMTRLWSATW